LIARYGRSPARSCSLDWYETLRCVGIVPTPAVAYLTRAAGQEPAMPVEGSALVDLLRERTAGS
jgi:hypothetical protein